MNANENVIKEQFTCEFQRQWFPSMVLPILNTTTATVSPCLLLLF